MAKQSLLTSHNEGPNLDIAICIEHLLRTVDKTHILEAFICNFYLIGVLPKLVNITKIVAEFEAL